MRALLAVALSVLAVAVPAARADSPCKPAGPLPQSKCTKDAQCCPGLVCQAAGSSKNNATTQCLPGCRIGGTFQAPGQRNTAPNNCQSCQPSVSTTAWTNVASGTTCRSSAGICDTAENCTGTSGSCPPDAAQPDGTPCNDAPCAESGTCISGACVPNTTTTTSTSTTTTTAAATCANGGIPCGSACGGACGGVCYG